MPSSLVPFCSTFVVTCRWNIFYFSTCIILRCVNTDTDCGRTNAASCSAVSTYWQFRRFRRRTDESTSLMWVTNGFASVVRLRSQTRLTRRGSLTGSISELRAAWRPRLVCWKKTHRSDNLQRPLQQTCSTWYLDWGLRTCCQIYVYICRYYQIIWNKTWRIVRISYKVRWCNYFSC